MALRDNLLNFQTINEREAVLNKWGGQRVLLRSLTGEQVREITTAAKGDAQAYSVLSVIAATLDPETKTPVFVKADRDALLKHDALAVAEISNQIAELCQMNPGSVAEAEKN